METVLCWWIYAMIFVPFFSFRHQCCFWVIYVRVISVQQLPVQWWEEEGGLLEATRWTKSLKEIFSLKSGKLPLTTYCWLWESVATSAYMDMALQITANNWQLPNNWWQITLVYLGDGMKPSPVLSRMDDECVGTPQSLHRSIGPHHGCAMSPRHLHRDPGTHLHTDN